MFSAYNGVMAKPFEEIFLEMLGKISRKLEEHDARFDAIEAKIDKIEARLDKHDELFEQILDGMAPEIKKTTVHGLKIKDHERRIRRLKAQA